MKNFRKVIAMLLTIALLTCLTGNVFAAVDDETSSNVSSLVIKEITREEYLENLAKIKGITINEADLLDRQQIQNNYEAEVRLHSLKRTNETIMPRQPIYTTVQQNFNAGRSGLFWGAVKGIANVRFDRYYSTSYGDYQKFSDVLDVGAIPSGSGAATWNGATQSASITGDDGYSNKLVMIITGNLEIEIDTSLTASAGLAGFANVGTSVSGKYIYRKFCDFQHTFGSNSYL